MTDKKLVNFRLSSELLNKLNEYSKETGKTKTQIIEEALNCLFERKEKENTELELLERQNEQLQRALQGFQIALQGKDELLNEKDERIKELKETIEILKQNQASEKPNKKPFWKFWK